MSFHWLLVTDHWLLITVHCSLKRTQY